MTPCLVVCSKKAASSFGEIEISHGIGMQKGVLNLSHTKTLVSTDSLSKPSRHDVQVALQGISSIASYIFSVHMQHFALSYSSNSLVAMSMSLYIQHIALLM